MTRLGDTGNVAVEGEEGPAFVPDDVSGGSGCVLVVGPDGADTEKVAGDGCPWSAAVAVDADELDTQEEEVGRVEDEPPLLLFLPLLLILMILPWLLLLLGWRMKTRMNPPRRQQLRRRRNRNWKWEPQLDRASREVSGKEDLLEFHLQLKESSWY